MYLDSSILVKLLVRESDSPFYGELVDGQPNVWSSELAITECWSALLRKESEGAISARTRREAWSRLSAYWRDGGLSLQPVTSQVLRTANEFMERCRAKAPVRTLDAIHLASCAIQGAYPLITNDRTMRRAAAALGMPVEPASDRR